MDGCPFRCHFAPSCQVSLGASYVGRGVLFLPHLWGFQIWANTLCCSLVLIITPFIW